MKEIDRVLFKRGLVAQHEAATAHERRNRSIDKEVNAKQERQNSGGGTILGQVWERPSANRSEQKEDAQLRQSLSPSRADDEERL